MPPELVRFIQKNLIFLSSLLFVVLLFIILNAPFDSNVWGNVSEWTMALVTAITAIYLYKTLQSQVKITQIEQNRYELEIMPDVVIVHDIKTQYVTITPINRPLRNATVKIIKKSDSVQRLAETDTYLLSTFIVGQPMPIQYILNTQEVKSPYILFTVEILYFNELGQKYRIDIAIIPTGNPAKYGPVKIN